MNRQRLHLKAPDNWVNDPNGFIYYKGNYHLFYQYFPYGPQWGTMHWGHAVSKDLVNWEHKGIALFPTKSEDRNGCFSGSAVERDGKMYLAFTGVHYEEINPDNIHVCLNERFESAQMMITSEDGFHFDNWEDKRVIIPPITDEKIGHRTHTRDPKLWRGKDAWYIIVGSTLEEQQGEVLFYRSEDLNTWSYVNKALKTPEYGWMWECPDYFEVEGGEVLLLSAMGIPQNGEAQEDHAICFPAAFQEENCEMKIGDTYQFLDYGLDLYAPQTTLDEEGRRVMVAWVRMPEVTEADWIGMYSSPRIVEMKNEHIYFRMHPNIRKAYSMEIGDVSQANPAGYMASFDLEDGEKVNIGGFLIYRKGRRIYTDRSDVFPAGEGQHLISETPEVKEGWKLEVLVDENLVEVYINDGEYVISNTVYGLKREITSSNQKEIVIHTVEEEII